MSNPRRPEPIPMWETKFPERLAQALATAHRLSEDELAAHDGDALIEAVLANHAASPVVPRFDLKWNKMQETNALGFETSDTAHPAHFSLNVPCEGAGSALFDVPDRIMNSGGTTDPLLRTKKPDYPAWQISLNLSLAAADDEVWLTFESVLRDAWDKVEESLTVAAKVANQRIDEHRAEVRAAISPVIKSRRARVIGLRSAAASLSIPLEPVATASLAVPLAPTLLTLEQVERSKASGTPEHALADDIANSLVKLITSFGVALERLPATADKLVGESEETIRDVLLFLLNANYRGLATGETFLGKGKTDILLRWQDRDAFVAECKIWHGETRFVEAIDQLLGYTVWRDTRIALILFVRDRKDVSTIIDKAATCIQQHKQCLTERPAIEPDAPREFVLASTVDNRRAIRLSLIPVVLPRPE
ncbi:hypothetical protein AB0E59_36225 [Lentzea sp. NPDC034063]|uniref:hypothetical protein n=1 Tax=unclassified Lentzea TaxID=2643253 RepID=UPI003404F4E4